MNFSGLEQIDPILKSYITYLFMNISHAYKNKTYTNQ